MVSFWPWRAKETSTATFERTLSNLSAKITKATVRRDLQRFRSRKLKALWTVYTAFAYILYSLILFLVTGWQSWGILEYVAVIGGPIGIYAVRVAIHTFYEYRIASTQNYLDNLVKEKEAAVEKFKKDTQFNSTQQLLEKYGAAPATPKTSQTKKKPTTSDNKVGKQPIPQRTNIPPPPTANIRRPEDSSQQIQPQIQPPGQQPQAAFNPQVDHLETGAEFAPNAFPPNHRYAKNSLGHTKWYDRLMDVLLGEDETKPVNRIALICSSCRLVNGQAPPGIKSMEELGRWKCADCKAWNGEENEVQAIMAKAVKGIKEEDEPLALHVESIVPTVGEEVVENDVDDDEEEEPVKIESPANDDLATPAQSTRSRKKFSAEDES